MGAITEVADENSNDITPLPPPITPSQNIDPQIT